MNVIHLITGRGPTGPAAAAMIDVKALQAAGHEACICSRSGSGLEDACRAENIPYIGGVKLGRGAMRLLGLPGDVRRLRSILRETRADVLHVHRSDDQLMCGAALGKSLSVSLIRTWHRDPLALPRPLISRLAGHVDGCIGVSRRFSDALQGAGARAAAFIHAAVDTDVFTPQGRERWKDLAATFFDRDSRFPPDDARVMAHVGRWKRERDGRDRGQQAALQVASALQTPAAWQAWLVGRGEMAHALRHEAYEILNLSKDRLRLIDAAVHAPGAFAALLARADLGWVFQPGSDGTSRAALEMLSCGVPLLVADLPGLREMAEENDAVRCLRPDDTAAWAEAAAEFLSLSAERQQRLRHSARERAIKVHSLRARGEALAAFYRDGIK